MNPTKLILKIEKPDGTDHTLRLEIQPEMPPELAGEVIQQMAKEATKLFLEK